MVAATSRSVNFAPTFEIGLAPSREGTKSIAEGVQGMRCHAVAVPFSQGPGNHRWSGSKGQSGCGAR